MPSPKDPVKREAWRKKIGEGNRGKHHSDKWRKEMSDRNSGKNNPNYGNHHLDETKLLIGNIMRGKPSPMRGKHHSEEAKRKNSDAHTGEKNPNFGTKRPEACRNMLNSIRGLPKTEEHRKNLSISLTGKLVGSRNPFYRKHHKEDSILKNIEFHIGGIWYGNVKYYDNPYCELWCPDLWHRIDEAQNYQSILSGKTKVENGGRALSRHHVYWQPKACCEWDEDAQGYYAMINIGTVGKSNWYKHYIRGDPNKFVLLTVSEHQLVKKDKLKWIKLFEELIETKLGGICYLPKVVL